MPSKEEIADKLAMRQTPFVRRPKPKPRNPFSIADEKYSKEQARLNYNRIISSFPAAKSPSPTRFGASQPSIFRRGATLNPNQVIDRRPLNSKQQANIQRRQRDLRAEQAAHAAGNFRARAVRPPTAAQRARNQSDPVGDFLSLMGKSLARNVKHNVEGNFIPGSGEWERRKAESKKNMALYKAGKLNFEDLPRQELAASPGVISALMQAGRASLRGVKPFNMMDLYKEVPQAGRLGAMGRVPASKLDGPPQRIPWLIGRDTGRVSVGPPGSQHGRLLVPGRDEGVYEGWLSLDRLTQDPDLFGSIQLATRGIDTPAMSALPEAGRRNLEELMNILLGPKSPIEDANMVIPKPEHAALDEDRIVKGLLELMRGGKSTTLPPDVAEMIIARQGHRAKRLFGLDT